MPGNTKPHRARAAKKAKRRPKDPGTLYDARAKVWEALETASEVMKEEDPALRLRAVHATTQAASAYAKLIEVGELEERMKELEASMAAAGLPRD